MSYSAYTPGLAPDERLDPPLGPRVWAGAILMVSSLGFLFLGGCFTLGILVLLNPPSLAGQPALGAPSSTPVPLSSEDITFMVTLYGLTGASVLAAGLLFVLGLIGLVRILYTKPAAN